MGGVTFSFNNAGSPRVLDLRHSPYNVEWTYNVNTSVTDTYTGQVVQILSINIDRLIIEGQFGREGAFGLRQASRGGMTDRYGNTVATGNLATRTLSDQFSIDGKFPGLYSMTEFFREYFAISAQGGDDPTRNPDANRYTQVPMTVSYDAGTSSKNWIITPVSFPSFRRSNEDFAPEWRVESYVIEADATIQKSQSQQILASINRIRGGIGFKTANPFSDPGATQDNLAEAEALIKGFKKLLPAFTLDELQTMIWNRVSIPQYEGQVLDFDPNQLADSLDQGIPGEITGEAVGEHTGPGNG
jgi:hypothetical protein